MDETQPVPGGKVPVHAVVQQQSWAFPATIPGAHPEPAVICICAPQSCGLELDPQTFPRCIIGAVKHRRGKKKIDLSSAVLSKYSQDKCKLIRNRDNSHIKRNGVSCVCQQAK